MAVRLRGGSGARAEKALHTPTGTDSLKDSDAANSISNIMGQETVVAGDTIKLDRLFGDTDRERHFLACCCEAGGGHGSGARVWGFWGGFWNLGAPDPGALGSGAQVKAF